MIARIARLITTSIAALTLVVALGALSGVAQAAAPQPSYALTCTWDGNFDATLTWKHVKVQSVLFTFYNGSAFGGEVWGTDVANAKRPSGQSSATYYGVTSVTAKVVYTGTTQPAEPAVATATCS